MDSKDPPKTVTVAYCDSEKTKFLGSCSGSEGCYLNRRKRAQKIEPRHGKRARYTPEVTQDYNMSMGWVDCCEHLRNIRTVARRTGKQCMPIFHCLIDSVMINAWCYYKRVRSNISRKRSIRLEFHEDIARSLVVGE